jgi:hypothetical protein
MALKSSLTPTARALYLRHFPSPFSALVGMPRESEQSETKTKEKEMQVRAERDFTTVCQKVLPFGFNEFSPAQIPVSLTLSASSSSEIRLLISRLMNF